MPKLKEREANAEEDRKYWAAYTSGKELAGDDFVREAGALRRARKGAGRRYCAAWMAWWSRFSI